MLDAEQIAPDTIRPLRRAEYDRMVELGWFEDERVELLRGNLVTMSPQGSRHADTVARLHERLFELLPKQEAQVRGQLPYGASDDSEPEPDLAVVPRADYSRGHPEQALLLIEVADSSLRKDRGLKLGIYAESGIPEYWIVDLQGDAVEVHTDPREGGYASARRFARGEEIALQAYPQVRLAVDDVLPPT